jgi:tRNA pseudouridine13 synthase
MRIDENYIFPYAWGGPACNADFKSRPEDFIVKETLPFEPCGDGVHDYLLISKIDMNTEMAARRLARHANCHVRDIGYAGLKDRHAVTQQWFSIPAEKSEHDWNSFNDDQIKIVRQTRHSHKLRRGLVKNNFFHITLRNIYGDFDAFEEHIEKIFAFGVPNYFGEQRFGHQRNNLKAANDFFDGKIKPKKFLKGMYFSTVRSWIFNMVLAQRVRQGNWNQPLEGDVFWLNESKRYFLADKIDFEIEKRCREFDIHPTGPLYGEGDLWPTEKAWEIEQGVLREYEKWCEALIDNSLKAQRRTFRVTPVDANCIRQDDSVVLLFTLPAGSYATSVVRELLKL